MPKSSYEQRRQKRKARRKMGTQMKEAFGVFGMAGLKKMLGSGADVAAKKKSRAMAKKHGGGKFKKASDVKMGRR